MQSDLEISNGYAYGTLKYVTGYTGFSGNVEEQSGNYIALKLNDVPEGTTVTYQKVGGSAAPVTLDSDLNIVVRIVDQNSVLRFTLTKDDETVVKDIDCSRLIYEASEAEEEIVG